MCNQIQDTPLLKDACSRTVAHAKLIYCQQHPEIPFGEKHSPSTELQAKKGLQYDQHVKELLFQGTKAPAAEMEATESF